MEQDRRRFRREACLISVVVRTGAQLHRATIINIAEQGAFVRAEDVLPFDTRVQLRFAHPWTGDAVTARAHVVRDVPVPGLGGPGRGFAVRFAQSLSELEDDPTSQSVAVPLDEDTERRRAAAAALASVGKRASMPPPSSKPRAPTRRVRFNGIGDGDSDGVLAALRAHGLSVRAAEVPAEGRLVRLEIEDAAGASIRCAARVVANRSFGAIRAFDAEVLHFLSSSDEQRFAALAAELRNG